MEENNKMGSKNLFLYLLLIIAGLVSLGFFKYKESLTIFSARIDSDVLNILGVILIMSGYLPMVAEVFKESMWKKVHLSNSRCLFLLLLFSGFLITVAQGFYSDYGSVLWLSISACCIIRATTLFHSFRMN